MYSKRLLKFLLGYHRKCEQKNPFLTISKFLEAHLKLFEHDYLELKKIP